MFNNKRFIQTVVDFIKAHPLSLSMYAEDVTRDGIKNENTKIRILSNDDDRDLYIILTVDFSGNIVQVNGVDIDLQFVTELQSLIEESVINKYQVIEKLNRIGALE
jgi:hypothetical protein